VVISSHLIALELISAEVFVIDSSPFVQLVSSRILHIRPHGRRQSVQGAFNFLSFDSESPGEFHPTPPPVFHHWALGILFWLLALWVLDLGSFGRRC
jgi:hypothetical protein